MVRRKERRGTRLGTVLTKCFAHDHENGSLTKSAQSLADSRPSTLSLSCCHWQGGEGAEQGRAKNEAELHLTILVPLGW